MKLNQTHEEMIRNFVEQHKGTKITTSKVQEIASQLFASVKVGGKGKKALPETIQIRERVSEFLKNQTSEFTSLDLAKAVNCSPLQANSALTYYKKEFNLAVTGKAEKEGKGKKPNLYKVC